MGQMSQKDINIKIVTESIKYNNIFVLELFKKKVLLAKYIIKIHDTRILASFKNVKNKK